jgi:hypothetical protein
MPIDVDEQICQFGPFKPKGVNVKNQKVVHNLSFGIYLGS